MGNKMKEWFEANQEIYAEFKSKIHSTLDILSRNHSIFRLDTHVP